MVNNTAGTEQEITGYSVNNMLTERHFVDNHDAVQIHTDEKQRHKQEVLYDALILDAKLRQSLVAMRSLGAHGKRVAALEVDNHMERSQEVPTFSSRWCQQGYVAPSYKEGPLPFLDYLQQLLKYTSIGVMIPSSDGTLELLREHRAEIESWGTKIALAKEEALAATIDKEQTLKIAEKLGLAVPRGVLISSPAEVREAIHEIGLPAVVKPVTSWQWGPQQGMRLVSRLVATLEEAREAVEMMTQFGGKTLIQQFLTGKREAVSFMYAQGEVYARFAQWAKRTQPQLGGTSVFRQSIAVPYDIGEPSERLVHELDLEGYSEVEFRRDNAGRPYLMEINPRLSASVEIAVRSGIDFPYLLYQWATGERIDHIEGYQVGGWMRYLEGDFLATLESFLQRGRPGVMPPTRAVWEFASTFLLPTGYDYVDKNDLLPAWSALKEFTDHIWYRLHHKRAKTK